MNQNAVVQSIAVMIALFGALFGMLFILDAPGNNLSRAFYICIGCGFLVALLNPKAGMILLVICCGFLDLAKRFLILYGNVNMLDLMSVLGTAPIILLGICLSVVIHRVLNSSSFTAREWGVGFLAAFVVVLTVISYIRIQGLLSGIAHGANGGAYAVLILFAGILYPTVVDQQRFLKLVCWIFTPVAFYGLWQAAFGWNNLEIAYMESGLTIGIGMLRDTIVRPFSTMNTTHSFSIFMATLSGLSVWQFFHQKADRRTWSFWTILFTIATFASFGRTAWALMLALPVTCFFFRRKGTTVFFYTSAIFGLILTINFGLLFIDTFDRTLSAINPESMHVQRALGMGTFGDRVMSFQNWTNPEAWSWFGKGDETPDYMIHDQLGQALYKFGGVGVIVSIIAFCAFLFYCHKKLLKVSDPAEKNMAIFYLAAVFGLLFTGILSGSHINVFPVNFLFWLLVGFLTKFFLLADRKPEKRPIVISIQHPLPKNRSRPRAPYPDTLTAS